MSEIFVKCRKRDSRYESMKGNKKNEYKRREKKVSKGEENENRIVHALMYVCFVFLPIFSLVPNTSLYFISY